MDFYRFDRQGNLEVRRGVHAVDSPAYFRDGWSPTPPETPVIDVTVAPTPAAVINDETPSLLSEGLPLDVEPEQPKPRRTRRTAPEAS